MSMDFTGRPGSGHSCRYALICLCLFASRSVATFSMAMEPSQPDSQLPPADSDPSTPRIVHQPQVDDAGIMPASEPEAKVVLKNQTLMRDHFKAIAAIPNLTSVVFIKCSTEWKHLVSLQDTDVAELTILGCDVDGDGIDAIVQLKNLQRLDFGLTTKLPRTRFLDLQKCKKLIELELGEDYGDVVPRLKAAMPGVKVVVWQSDPPM